MNHILVIIQSCTSLVVLHGQSKEPKGVGNVYTRRQNWEVCCTPSSNPIFSKSTENSFCCLILQISACHLCSN